jgi:hypothetical protein
MTQSDHSMEFRPRFGTHNPFGAQTKFRKSDSGILHIRKDVQ